MTETPPVDFKSIHKRAAEICEQDTILAYAVAKELRKRLVMRPSEEIKQEMMMRLCYTFYNNLIEIQAHADDPKYAQHFLNMVADTLIVGFDILNDKLNYAETSRSPKG